MRKTRKGHDVLWHEGFEAGRLLISLNPYPDGSSDAGQWDAGWAEGVMMRTGGDYRSEPPPSGWHRRLLTWLMRP